MADAFKSWGRTLYLTLMLAYLALLAAIFSWPAPGLWAVPAPLLNAGVVGGPLALLSSLLFLKSLRLLAVLGLVISFATLAVLLLPTL